MSLAYAAVFAAPMSSAPTVASMPASRALIRLVWGNATLAMREVGEGTSLHSFVGNLVDEVGPDVELVRVVGTSLHTLSESGDMSPLAIGQKRTIALASGFEVVIDGTNDDSGLIAPLATAALGLFGLSVLGSFAVHLGLFSAIAFNARMGDGDSDTIDREQVMRMQHMLTAMSEREREEEKADTAQSGASPSGDPGQAAKGAPGKMGLQTAPARDTRYAVQGRPDNANPQLRAQELREAATGGLIGMLAAYAPTGGPAAAWADPSASGRDERDAVGKLFGQTIGDSQGNGGLALNGDGEGGGGPGTGIGASNIGGLGNCVGANCVGGPGGNGPGGIGNSRGFLPGDRTPKAKWPREDKVSVGGHLPPEIIQRTVRQNFGRFRLCYEAGLRSNPNLHGRVTTRFVIDRTGAVSLTADGGSDIGDSSVVSCVVRAFGGLSFAAPEGGTVTVTYPLVFSAES